MLSLSLKMQLKLFLNSAYDLKNVNWRYGDLQPYAVAWIDSSGKWCTKIDVYNGENPVWNEMFTIHLPSVSRPETAILHIDIVHAKSAADMKPLIGSAKMPLRAALDGASSQGKAYFSLMLERPSGRPQGILEIQIEILDFNFINQTGPYGQQAPYMSPQPQPQPRPQPRPRPQLQPQYQAWQMSQYPNMPASVRPGYAADSPQNLRPFLAQQPGNAMLMPNMRPQCRPVANQVMTSLGNTLCTLAFGVSPRQIGRVLGSFQRMQVGTFRGPQPTQMGMVKNNTGLLGNGNNGTYCNDPSAAQGYDNAAGYDATGTPDNVGYDGSNFGDGQFGTDGGFGCGGSDLGGFDNGGLDMGMFGNGGLDLGGFDASGIDLGGLASEFDNSM